MTNNLEYYVPESERALRALHLPRQFAQAEVEGKRKRERNAKNIWTIRGGGEEEVEHAAVKADSERLDKQCQKLEMSEESWERAVRVQRRMSRAVSLPSLATVATDSELGSGQDMLNDPLPSEAQFF